MARRMRQGAVSTGLSGLGLSPLLDRARKFLAESLFKNSLALVINIGIGAVSGYGSLTLLTHVFSRDDIGLSATAVSALSLITFITRFGVTYSVPRFLPTAKNRTAMINTVLTAVVVATMIGAVVFLALPYAKNLYPLGGLIFGIAFVVTACFQAGQIVLSTVLIADRAADKMVIFGTIPKLARLAAPVALSILGALGSFVARVAADFFGVAVYGVLLARRGHRFRLKVDVAETKDLIKFSTGMYVANIIGGLPQLVLPLVVLSRVGPGPAAYWSIAMSIATLLFSLPGAVTTALLPEVSLRPAERRALLLRSSYLITGLVTPLIVIAFAAAPIALAVFGKSYASGALVPLRWLMIAAFITMLNYVSGAILFIAKKSTMITIVNLVDAIIVLGLVMLWATNVTQIAIAWTIGDVGNTVLFGFFAFLALRQVDGRWERLGADAALPARRTATSQQRALSTLATLAERQRAVDTYKSRRPRDAGRQRQDLIAVAGPPRAQRPGSEDREHRQAFELLFTMAELQRTTEEPDGHPREDLRNP